MRSILILTLAALMVCGSNQEAPHWCKPEVFIDRLNFYRQNPAQLANFIENNYLKKIHCHYTIGSTTSAFILNGADGNNVALSIGGTDVAERCPRIA